MACRIPGMACASCARLDRLASPSCSSILLVDHPVTALPVWPSMPAQSSCSGSPACLVQLSSACLGRSCSSARSSWHASPGGRMVMLPHLGRQTSLHYGSPGNSVSWYFSSRHVTPLSPSYHDFCCSSYSCCLADRACSHSSTFGVKGSQAAVNCFPPGWYGLGNQLCHQQDVQ